MSDTIAGAAGGCPGDFSWPVVPVRRMVVGGSIGVLTGLYLGEFAQGRHRITAAPESSLARSYDAALILLGFVPLIIIAGRVIITFSRRNAE